MAGTIIADRIEAATASQLIVENGIALTPPTIADVNGVAIGAFCRAWVNWQGTGTVTIRSSFNVSSITDGGVGQYTVNFTNAMPDINYACLSACGSVSGANGGTLQTTQIGATVVANTTTAQWVAAATDQGNLYDTQFASVAIFR